MEKFKKTKSAGKVGKETIPTFPVDNHHKMKKIITKADIKKMGFTEKEQQWFVDIADEINKNRENNDSARLYFAYPYTGPIECFPSMYNKAVLYYAKQYIIENGGYHQTSLRKIAWYIANKFFTYPDAIIRILKGLAYNNSNIYVTDTFGLDVFEYTF